MTAEDPRIAQLRMLTAIDTSGGKYPYRDYPVLSVAFLLAAYDDQKIDAALAVNGSTSDGYHTFNELYDYRMLYHAHAAQGWLAGGSAVVKSWHHSDGEECFGGGWFIVSAELSSGQVTNHYKAEYWDLFDVPKVDLPPKYDGHSPNDVALRLRAALTTTPEKPDGEIS